MTYDEAVKSGMDALDIFLSACTGEIDPPEEKEFVHPIHGRVVETRFDAYHDVTVYEDGHEERYYIGD